MTARRLGGRRFIAVLVAVGLLAFPAYLWPGAGPGLTVCYTVYTAVVALLAGTIALLDESRKPRTKGDEAAARSENTHVSAIPPAADRDVREVGAMAFFCFFGFFSAIFALIAGLAYGTPEQVESVMHLLAKIGLPAPPLPGG